MRNRRPLLLSRTECPADNGASSPMTIFPLSPRFVHRTLDDGSVDSICLNCFLAISRAWGDFKVTEEELVEIEAAHRRDATGKSTQF